MSKPAQGVGAEDTVERTGEHARHIERGDAHPAPRNRYVAGAEAAQFDLVGRQAAGKAAYLPVKFDARGLRADAFGGGRRHDRPFGAGIQQQGQRGAIGDEGDDRRVVQGRNDDLADPAGATAGSSGIRRRYTPQRRCEQDSAAQNFKSQTGN
jgi:hypothetical protein